MAKVYMDKRTGWWCMDYRDVQGRRRQVKAGRTKIQAEAMLRKKLDEKQEEIILGYKRIKNARFDLFAREYLEKYSKVNKRSWKRDELSLKHLIVFFGSKYLHEISPKDIECYKSERSILVAKATVNRELACFKHLFTIAIQWGTAKDNPVKLVKMFKENNKRMRYLEPKQLDLLYASSQPHIKDIIRFAVNTGMRFSEILNLKWNDIDFNQNLIMVRDAKNYEAREIPMNKNIQEVLNNTPIYRNVPYIFCKEDGRQRRSVRTGFEKAVKRAGIIDFHFHDLRHTFASHLVMAGVDLKTVQELLGHKDIQMTMRYSHLSPAHKSEAVSKLERYQKAESAGRVATYMQHRIVPKTAVAVSAL